MCYLLLKQHSYGQKFTLPVAESKDAVLRTFPESPRALTVNSYKIPGDNELIDPITVYWLYVAKAMRLLGELLSVTVTSYEVAPVTPVHWKNTILDVDANTVAWWWERWKKRMLITLRHALFYTYMYHIVKILCPFILINDVI